MKFIEFKNHKLDELEKEINDFVYTIDGKKWFTMISLNVQRIVGDYGEQWFNAIIVYEEINNKGE